MAGELAFELFSKLTLDTSEFDKGLDKARGTAESGGSRIGSVLSTGLKAAGVALAAASTAVVAFGKSSVDTGMEFDKAMSQVAATMGVTVGELSESVGTADTSFGHFEGNLREFAQFLGENTAFSATQAAEALNYMALAGYDTQESMDMLPSVLSLAAAGNFDLARASDMVTDTQTAFGISAERTAQMVDEMAKAASTGNTSVEQLGDAFLVVGGLAQELNGGFVTLADGTTASVDGVQELEIALTAMANAGVKGSEAGTHMRNMLLKLSSPTKEGKEAFEKLGVSVFDSTGKMRSMKDIFGDLDTALSRLTQQQKIEAISDIFNVRDVASAEAILNAVGQDWDSIGEAILNAKGAADQMAATQLDNLAGDITLFKSALESAKIAISDSLKPTLRDFVQFGTSSVQQLAKAFREDGLQGALNALGPIIEQGIGLIFSKLPAVLNAAVALLEAFVNGIITNLPQLIPAAIQLVQQLTKSIVENLPMLLDATVEIMLAIADGLIQALPDLIPAIVQIVLTIVEKLTDPDTVTKLLDAALRINLALAEGLIKSIPEILKAIPQIILNIVQSLLQGREQLRETGREWIAKMKEGFTEKFSDFYTSASEFASNALETVKKVWNLAKAVGSLLVTVIKNGITAKKNELIKSAGDMATKASDSIKTKWQNAKTLGSNLIAGLRNGIADKASDMNTAISKLGENIGNYWKKFGEASKTYGAAILAGLVNGIASKVSSVYDVYKRIVNNIVESVREVIDKARSWGSGLMTSFVNGMVEKFNSLVDKLRQMGQAVKDYLHFTQPDKGPLSGPNGFESYAPDMMKTFAKGITDNADLVTSAISRSFDFGDQIAGFSDGAVVRRGSAQSVGGGVRNMTTILQLDRYTLGRVVYELYNEEQQRVGVKLAGGIA